jgi:hypothetical protein
MGAVYENSYLTVAVLQARGSQDGCFTLRNPLMLQNCWLCKDSDDTVFLVTQVSDFRYEVTRFEHAPLCLRGWALQERILSLRTLYFSEQLFWECHGGMAAEFPNRDSYLKCLCVKSLIHRPTTWQQLSPSIPRELISPCSSHCVRHGKRL